MKLNMGFIKNGLFFISFGTALWGSFEQAYNAGASPVWSGTWGFPVPHHYIIGFAGMLIAYFALTKNEWISLRLKIKKIYRI